MLQGDNSSLSLLQSKARLTSEFIYLARVLSDPQIPYQALNNQKSQVDRKYTGACGEYTSVSGKMTRNNEKRQETMRNDEKR